MNILEKINSLDTNTITILLVSILVVLLVIVFIMISNQRKQKMKKLSIKELPEENTENVISASVEEDEAVAEIKVESEKKEDLSEKEDATTPEISSLEAIKMELLKEKNKPESQLSSYEQEQEEKAIISYDELIAQSNNVSIEYSNITKNDDVLIKQVDLEKTGKIELDPIKRALNSKISLSYEHEQEFLESLKQLQKLLNNWGIKNDAGFK